MSGISRFWVERSSTGSDPWTTVSSRVNGVRFTVIGLLPATTYHFRVRAHGDGITYASLWSAESVPDSATTDANPPPPQLPTVTISRSIPASPLIKEGDVVAFILTASAAPSTALDVEVRVTRGAGTVPTPITIAAGETTARFELQTVDDTIDEPVETVTVAVVDGSDYNLGSTSSVDLEVSDDDLPPAPSRLYTNGHRVDGKITLQWGAVSRAHSYKVRYIEEVCNSGGCDASSSDRWQTVSVEITGGGSTRKVGTIAWPDGSVGKLHRVQVQTVNVDMEVSEWPEMDYALVYPTDEHPSIQGIEVATISLHSFQPNESFDYVICVPGPSPSTKRQATPGPLDSSLRPSPLPFDGADAAIMDAIGEWATYVNERDARGGNLLQASGSTNTSCEETDLDNKEQVHNQIVFHGHEAFRRVCNPLAFACWTDMNSNPPGNLRQSPFKRSIVLLDTEDWNVRNREGCKKLYAVMVHESGHAFGLGHSEKIEGLAMSEGYSYSNSTCLPTGYDAVAMMANYQSRHVSSSED